LYLSDGLRKDEATFKPADTSRLLDVLKKHGVPQDVLDQAAREIEAA
jgi:hypothetical protein